MAYTLKGVAGQNYNQLTPAEQAQVQSSGDTKYQSLISAYQPQIQNGNLSQAQAEASARNAAFEEAQRFGESIFTQKSDAMRLAERAKETGVAPPKGNANTISNLQASGQEALKSLIPAGTAAADNIPNLGTHNTANTANQPITLPQGTQYNIGNTTLTRGSKGEEVKQLQQALNASGIGVQLKIDGDFGPATEAAVRFYQNAKGLKVDGIVGQQTRGTLNGQQGNNDGVSSLLPAQQAIEDAVNNNPELKRLQDLVATIPELKSALDIVNLKLAEKVESGQKVNPDLTITPELTAKFLEQATSELDPYYQELIRQNKQDLSTSFQQLQQDYNTQISREQPAFQQNLENQDITEANQGTAFSSGRVKREGDIITGEQQKLDDYFQSNQRSAEGLARTGERQIGSRAFSDLGIPSLQSYAAQRGTIAPRGQLASTGSRSLYSPQGGLFGELPGQAKTAIDTRASALSEAEIKKRILDSGYGLGSTSLG